MTISGFTFVRNATKFYYPVKAAIESILPIVDEFIVALGNCDNDDATEQAIRSIGSDKIKIINTVWDVEHYANGMEYARQTDIAKAACQGDWLFYIQCDEVVHEKYLPVIRKRCEELLHDKEVDGLLFRYLHFWGDYEHYIISHAWYPNEIRIIRNDKHIHSWRDAQSFRRIPEFDGKNYYQKKGTYKLNVARVDAAIHHYGFVRPPDFMRRKIKNHKSIYQRKESASKDKGVSFSYGDLSKLSVYQDTQPVVMKEFLEKFNWGDILAADAKLKDRPIHKHERLKYRILTFFEQNFLGGNLIGGFKNYNLIRR